MFALPVLPRACSTIGGMDAAQASHVFAWVVATIAIVGVIGATVALISMAKSSQYDDK